MPRRPRLNLASVPLHVIQRGNNRQACFFAEEDHRFYLYWLRKGADNRGQRRTVATRFPALLDEYSRTIA